MSYYVFRKSPSIKFQPYQVTFWISIISSIDISSVKYARVPSFMQIISARHFEFLRFGPPFWIFEFWVQIYN